MPTRLARVASRRGDASDADEAVVRAQESYGPEPNDWSMVDASDTPADTLARARKIVT
jgi:predicted kinase